MSRTVLALGVALVLLSGCGGEEKKGEDKRGDPGPGPVAPPQSAPSEPPPESCDQVTKLANAGDVLRE